MDNLTLDIAGLKFAKTRPKTKTFLLWNNPLKPHTHGQIVRRGNFWFKILAPLPFGISTATRYHPNRLPQ